MFLSPPKQHLITNAVTPSPIRHECKKVRWSNGTKFNEKNPAKHKRKRRRRQKKKRGCNQTRINQQTYHLTNIALAASRQEWRYDNDDVSYASDE